MGEVTEAEKIGDSGEKRRKQEIAQSRNNKQEMIMIKQEVEESISRQQKWQQDILESRRSRT